MHYYKIYFYYEKKVIIIFICSLLPLEAIVYPTKDEKVSDIINVEVVKFTKDTTGVLVEIGKPTEKTAEPFFLGEPRTQEMDLIVDDGLKVLIDTTILPNGLYKIVVATSWTGGTNENPFNTMAVGQLLIEN